MYTFIHWEKQRYLASIYFVPYSNENIDVFVPSWGKSLWIHVLHAREIEVVMATGKNMKKVVATKRYRSLKNKMPKQVSLADNLVFHFS